MSEFSFSAMGERLTDTSAIPTRLKEFDSWLVAIETHDPIRDNILKRPVFPSGSANDTTSFEDACNHLEDAVDSGESAGLGFQFSGTPFCGLDFDDVAQDGCFVIAEAYRTVEFLNSWTEISVSGTGAHVLLEGSLCREHKTRKDFNEWHVEAYDEGRFFLLTGRQSPSSNDRIMARQSRIEEVHSQFPKRSGSSTVDSVAVEEAQESPKAISADAEEIHATVKRDARNGSQYAQKTLNLWNDNIPATDRSTQDAEFLMRLCFYCRCDHRLIRECFSSSSRGWRRHAGQEYTEYRDWLSLAIDDTLSAFNGNVYSGRYAEA